ncbi:MAG TPA: non-homologous end-joining DNA ligase [Acidimicrobiales bacterium]|nr:non-homologous end-joining DNA ligase [Acidimicrobiales bacterium]
MPATWRQPMLAQLLRFPEERRVLDAGDWVFERKLDGLRCLATRNGAEVQLWSRNRLSFSARFPDVVSAVAQLPVDDVTLDGEIVAFDDEGRTSFALLQQSGRRAAPVYVVFDVLHLVGNDTRDLPLTDRSELVDRLVAAAGGPTRGTITTVERLTGDPAQLLDEACRNGWEGLVAKRPGSLYCSGRSPDWRKLKCSASQELVVGGWTEPTGSRSALGALLVGYYDEDGRLVFAGKVGTGFSEAELGRLHAMLAERSTTECPFAPPVRVKGSHWVRPELVAAVSFTEWTRDGKLRHPRYEGLRTDKAALDVRREVGR